MTVLEKKAASGVDGRRLTRYTAVAILAGAVGVAAGLGLDRVAGSAGLSPAEISQIRGVELADHLQRQWVAEVSATKNADLIEFYKAPFMARVAQMQEQRAADMAEHFSNLHKGELARINEQRAADMVEYQYGGGSADR